MGTFALIVKNDMEISRNILPLSDAILALFLRIL
jgi:hypothetical protein